MRTERTYYVYILANAKNGTLYTGVTNNLIERVRQHKSKKIKGFTAKYNVTQLVYYEQYGEVGMAISREKNLKAWKRSWKLELIEKENPSWKDLYDDLLSALEA